MYTFGRETIVFCGFWELTVDLFISSKWCDLFGNFVIIFLAIAFLRLNMRQNIHICYIMQWTKCQKLIKTTTFQMLSISYITTLNSIVSICVKVYNLNQMQNLLHKLISTSLLLLLILLYNSRLAKTNLN